MKKKLLIILLTIMLTVICSYSAFACDLEVQGSESLAYKDQVDEVEENINLESYKIVRGLKYHYKVVKLPCVDKEILCCCGNQDSGGAAFPYGGGFFYSSSGGPSISAGVSLAFPAPFNFVSFNVNCGTSGISGEFHNAPNKEDHFKLYVIQHYKVYPYVVYRARSGTENWKIDHVGETHKLDGHEAVIKKVS